MRFWGVFLLNPTGWRSTQCAFHLGTKVLLIQIKLHVVKKQKFCCRIFSIHVMLLIPIFVQFKMHPRFACCTKNSIKMCPTNTERTPCSQVRSRQPGVFSETSRLVYARDGAAVAHHAAPRTPSYNLLLYFSSVPPQALPPPRWSAWKYSAGSWL